MPQCAEPPRDVRVPRRAAHFRGTEIEAAAGRLGCTLEWHSGLALTTEELDRYPDYRGGEYVDIGRSLARDGVLDPGVIGTAARSGQYSAQTLKRVWHCVARFGTTYR